MIEMFRNLSGDLLSSASPLEQVLASIFFLFVVTEIFRFLEMMFDFIFRRKR